LNKEELKKLVITCDKIYDSDEYKTRREEQNRFLLYYSGKYWPKQKNDDESKKSEIFANLIFSTVMTIAPMLTDSKPIWNIRSRSPEYQPIAEVYKAAGDALWCVEEMDSKIFKVVIDALVMKNGIAQVSFDPNRKIGGEIGIEIIDPRTYFQAPGFDDNWDALCVAPGWNGRCGGSARCTRKKARMSSRTRKPSNPIRGSPPVYRPWCTARKTMSICTKTPPYTRYG